MIALKTCGFECEIMDTDEIDSMIEETIPIKMQCSKN